MKLKVYPLIFVVFFATSSILIQTGKASANLPTIYVNPSSLLVPVGGQFTVNVCLTNVSNLYGYEVWLSFDPSKLSVTSVRNDSYLNQPTLLWVQNLNNTGGYMDYAITSTLPAKSRNASSPAPLITINFTALAQGTSTLHLDGTKTKLVSSVNDGSPIPYVTADGTVTIQAIVLQAQAGTVGITGYKLLLGETMNNSLGPDCSIDYYWNFSAQKWSGTQWIAVGISSTTNPVTDYIIPAGTTVDLPYCVYLLSSSAVTQGDWLKVSYTFQWSYGGNAYSCSYSTKLNVHPADTAGGAVVAPYFGADGKVSTADLTLLAREWGKGNIPWTGTFNPTDQLHLADTGMYGKISTGDLTILARGWGARGAWSNTPPPG